MKDLFEQLFIDGVHLITRLKKGMKNALMLQRDKIMLRKRSLIETVNDQLKNICQIEHTRHRCFSNFIINLLSALIAFSFFDKKKLHQHCRGVYTSLFPSGCLGRTRAMDTAMRADRPAYTTGLACTVRRAPRAKRKSMAARSWAERCG